MQANPLARANSQSAPFLDPIANAGNPDQRFEQVREAGLEPCSRQRNELLRSSNSMSRDLLGRATIGQRCSTPRIYTLESKIRVLKIDKPVSSNVISNERSTQKRASQSVCEFSAWVRFRPAPLVCQLFNTGLRRLQLPQNLPQHSQYHLGVAGVEIHPVNDATSFLFGRRQAG